MIDGRKSRSIVTMNMTTFDVGCDAVAGLDTTAVDEAKAQQQRLELTKENCC